MATDDKGYLRSIRAMFIAHFRTENTIGNYSLFEAYLLLLVAACEKANTTFSSLSMWINEDGGYGPIPASKIDEMSALIVASQKTLNPAERTVTGLTDKGKLFLKDHIDSLKEELPLFGLCGKDILAM